MKEEDTRVDTMGEGSHIPTASTVQAGSGEPITPTSALTLHDHLMSGYATTEVVRFAANRLRRFGETIDALRADLWNIAGTIVAACDSQKEHIASVACMEGSPLVDHARAVIRRYDLRNETAGGGNQQLSDLRGDPGAPRTVNGEARDKSASAEGRKVGPHPARRLSSARVSCISPKVKGERHG